MFVNTYSHDGIIVAWGGVSVNWWIVQNEPKIFVHCTEKQVEKGAFLRRA